MHFNDRPAHFSADAIRCIGNELAAVEAIIHSLRRRLDDMAAAADINIESAQSADGPVSMVDSAPSSDQAETAVIEAPAVAVAVIETAEEMSASCEGDNTSPVVAAVEDVATGVGGAVLMVPDEASIPLAAASIEPVVVDAEPVMISSVEPAEMTSTVEAASPVVIPSTSLVLVASSTRAPAPSRRFPWERLAAACAAFTFIAAAALSRPDMQLVIAKL